MRAFVAPRLESQQSRPALAAKVPSRVRRLRGTRPAPSSLKLDLAVETDVDLQGRNLERDPGRERFGALDLPRRERLRHRELDLALRADAHHLEKLSNA